MIERDFKALVDRLWPQGAISFFEKEQLEQKVFLKNRTKVYIPNAVALQKLDNFVNATGEEADKALVVTGEKGMGKSALIANWIQRISHRDAQEIRDINTKSVPEDNLCILIYSIESKTNRHLTNALFHY